MCSAVSTDIKNGQLVLPAALRQLPARLCRRYISIYVYIYSHVSGFQWLKITDFELDDWIYWHFFTITINDWDSLHSLLLFHCDWLGSHLRLGHLRITTDEWRMKSEDSLATELSWTVLRTPEWVRVRVIVTLRLAVYRQSVRLGVEPLKTHGQNFFLNWTPAVIVLM
jgi:hypothetical protein